MASLEFGSVFTRAFKVSFAISAALTFSALMVTGCASQQQSDSSQAVQSAEPEGSGEVAIDSANKHVAADFYITADGITADATPIIMKLEGCCARTDGIVEYAVIPVTEDGRAELEGFDLVAGSYHVSFASPIMPDGTLYSTGAVRECVIDDDTMEGHAKMVAERDGKSYDELLEKYKSDGKEWIGTGFEGVFTAVPPESLTDDVVAQAASEFAEYLGGIAQDSPDMLGGAEGIGAVKGAYAAAIEATGHAATADLSAIDAVNVG